MIPRELDEHDAGAQMRAVRMLQEAFQCDLVVDVWRTIGELIVTEGVPWDDPKWFTTGPNKGWRLATAVAWQRVRKSKHSDPDLILRLIALLALKWFDIRRQPCTTTGAPDAQPPTP